LLAVKLSDLKPFSLRAALLYLRGEVTPSVEATEVGPMRIPEMPKG